LVWAPPDGESIYDAMLRIREMYDPIIRSNDKNVIVVCHGEIVESIIRMFNDLGTFHDWKDNQEKWGYLLNPVNCQIIHLSKVDPQNGEQCDYLRYVRSIVPWDLGHSCNCLWEAIERKRYSSEELLEIVEKEI